MSVYMSINSQALADQHRAHIERRERIAAAARKHEMAAKSAPPKRYPKSVCFGQDADAHVMSWKMYGRTIPVRPIDLDVVDQDENAVVVHQSRTVIVGTAAVGLIIRTVARHYGVKVEEMKSHRRTAVLALPRHVAMYLAKEITTRSFPEIGCQFGDRDHTTIMYGAQKIAALRLVDGQVDDDIKILTEMLLGGSL